MIKMLLVILLVALNAQVYDPPPINPLCESPWRTYWEIGPNHPGCTDQDPWGSWVLWACDYQKWSNFHQKFYKALIIVYTCEYPDPPTSIGPFDAYLIFAPIVQFCERDKVTGVCPVASSIRP